VNDAAQVRNDTHRYSSRKRVPLFLERVPYSLGLVSMSLGCAPFSEAHTCGTAVRRTKAHPRRRMGKPRESDSAAHRTHEKSSCASTVPIADPSMARPSRYGALPTVLWRSAFACRFRTQLADHSAVNGLLKAACAALCECL
jgi:hypothetical protein